MATSIKITELTSIGANISHTSLAAVVDMAGTPETKKATLQTVGNLILSGAGGKENYKAFLSTTTNRSETIDGREMQKLPQRQEANTFNKGINYLFGR